MERSVVRVTFAVAVFLLSLVFSTQVYSAQEVIKLRYSTWGNPTQSVTVIAEQWGKELEKRTNGRVKVTVFAGGTLSAPNMVYDGLVKGAFDVGSSVFAYNTGRFPLTEVLDLPLGCRDGYTATMVANAFFKQFKPVLKEYDGVKMLYLYGPGPTLLHTKKMIDTTDKIKGMRIRSSGLSAKIVEALGGIPVTITLPETYDALHKGLADGILNPSAMLQVFKFADLLPYTLQDHGVSTIPMCWVAMNKKKWDSLPKDVQEIIDQLNGETAEKQARANIQEDKDSEVYLQKMGHQTVGVTKEQEAKTAAKMKPILEAYVQSSKAKSLPGEEALKFCLDYIKTHQ